MASSSNPAIPVSALCTDDYLKLFTVVHSPTFIGIPQIIRKEIYSYLLSTSHTQRAPAANRYDTPTPTSYKEARPVLYKQNTFVTFYSCISFMSKMFVTWDFPLVADRPHSEPDRAVFPEKAAVMRIRAYLRVRNRDIDDGGCTFVLAAGDLPKLAQSIYEMDLQLPMFSSSLGLELTVCTGKIVPQMERMLLGRLRELRGLKGSVVRGNVTPSYARETEALMMTKRGTNLESILKLGLEVKEEGNKALKKTGDWNKALRKWLHVGDLVGGACEIHPSAFTYGEVRTHREVRKLLIAVSLNAAMAQYMLKNYRAVIANTQLFFKHFGDESLSTPMDRAKMYLRKGLALTAMGMEEEAIADLNRGLRLAPGDKDILAAIKAAEKHAILRQQKKEKSEMEKVFGSG